MQFETLKTMADPGVFYWGWGRVRPMMYSPLLAKQYFPRQRRSVCTDWETRDRLYFLSWWTIMATTRSITGSSVSTSQIQWTWKWEADAEQEELKPWMVWCLMSGCQDLHSYALTPWPWQWRWRNLYNRFYQTQEEDVPKGRGLNYNVQPRLVGAAVEVWGVWERSNLL